MLFSHSVDLIPTRAPTIELVCLAIQRASQIYILSSSKILDFDWCVSSLLQTDRNKIHCVQTRLQADHLTGPL
jgi:hypothetical protein